MRNFHRPGRSTAYGVNGMAATSSPQATLAAIDVLRAGGNAVDAAVAAAAVVCVTEPQMTGIGGDGFALIGLPDGRVEGLNASGRSAGAADADWLKSSGLKAIDEASVHAVTVPGVVDGWAGMLARHGTMDLAEALKPAIALAEDGVPVAPRVARDWARETDRLAGDEGAAKHLLLAGRAPAEGEVMRYPALAQTLRTIARDGRDGFYTGAVAEDIVGCLAGRGSLLTLDDFAATRSDWIEPIATTYREREILEIPPNGQGIAALIALNILAHLDIGRYEPESPERRHLEIEAVRLAWVLRNRYVADQDYADLPVRGLLSKDYAARLASRIDIDHAIADPALDMPKPASDTIYLTVVDKDRLAVSLINSIFHSFGSGIVSPECGVTLQNRGACFVTEPGHPNCIGPGKRPLHTIIPAMVRHGGRVEMPFGVMGGSYQPMGHVAVMVNRYVYGMDPQEALDFPRAFHDDGILGVEETVPPVVRDGLKARGHRVEVVEIPFGGGQIIAIDHRRGVLAGGSDHRKDGFALGY